MTDPVDAEFERLGHTPDYPPDTIRGVKLTDGQFDDYVRISGKLAKSQLDSLVGMPQWDSIPDPSKLSLMKATIAKSRDIAQTAIMMKSMGTPNDIVRTATDAKLAWHSAAQAQTQMRAPDA